MPEPARGQSPRHLLRTITKITDAKFCVQTQPILSGGQSPGLVPVITTEDPLNGYINSLPPGDKGLVPNEETEKSRSAVGISRTLATRPQVVNSYKFFTRMYIT